MDTASLSLRRFRRDCLLGALSALLMLACSLWAGHQIRNTEE